MPATLPTFRRYIHPETTLHASTMRVDAARTSRTSATSHIDSHHPTHFNPENGGSVLLRNVDSNAYTLCNNQKSELACVVLLLDIKLASVLGYCN